MLHGEKAFRCRYAHFTYNESGLRCSTRWKVFNAIQGINVHPLDCAIGFPRNTYSLESDLSSKKHWAWVEEYVRVEDFACESHAEQVQAGTKGVGNKTTKKSCRCLKRFCFEFQNISNLSGLWSPLVTASLPPLSKLIHSGNGICSCLKHAIKLWWLLKRLRKAIKLTDIINTCTDKVLQ